MLVIKFDGIDEISLFNEYLESSDLLSVLISSLLLISWFFHLCED